MNQHLTKRMMAGLGVGALALAAMPKAAAAPFSTFAYPATSAPTNRTTAARLADFINVKDYGAKGDGVTNDGPAIQAALDAAYGPASSPHGTSYWLNMGVYFPAGKYLIGQQLFINHADGAWLFGAGKYATWLVYTGPNSLLPSGDTTSLLTCRSMDRSRIERMTFDVTSSNATVGVQLMNFGSIPDDGTGNSWIDCAFVGASVAGFVCSIDGSAQTGSEELFLACTFSACQFGMLIQTQNALDYSVIGCAFKNCIRGINVLTGSVNLIAGTSFDNPSYATFTGSVAGGSVVNGNVQAPMTVSGVSGALAIGQSIYLPIGGFGGSSLRIIAGSGLNWTVSYPYPGTTYTFGPVSMTASGLDIYARQAQCPAIIGCRSTSPNFCEGGPVAITGCYHNPSNPGGILNWVIDSQDQPQGIVEGCLGGANSQFYSANISNLLYLRGSTFNNAGYLTNHFTGSGTVKENI